MHKSNFFYYYFQLIKLFLKRKIRELLEVDCLPNFHSSKLYKSFKENGELPPTIKHPSKMKKQSTLLYMNVADDE